MLSERRSLLADRVVGRITELSEGPVVGAVGSKYVFIMRIELQIIDRLWSASGYHCGQGWMQFKM